MSLPRQLDSGIDLLGGHLRRVDRVAAGASAIPLSVYYAIGRFVRAVSVIVITWIASLMLLYPYAFIASICVVTQTQCGPGASDGPFG